MLVLSFWAFEKVKLYKGRRIAAQSGLILLGCELIPLVGFYALSSVL